MWLLGLLFYMGPHAWAEMGGDEYRSSRVLRTPAERARIERELEAARLRELEAERQARQRQAEEQLRLQRQLQQRPLEEQLLDQRCSGCHQAALVRQAVRGELGWRWTVERMRLWHGAELQSGEAAALATFLARTQGSDEVRRRESRWAWGLGLTVVALLAYAAGKRWFRIRRLS